MLAEYAFGPARSDADLRAILTIQRANAPDLLSETEQREQGFVTVRHDPVLLADMNTAFPHTVARYRGEVVGYALCMLPQFAKRVPVLAPLFARIPHLAWQGESVTQIPYVIMGQVAVAKSHRGRRLVDTMYADLCSRLYPDYQLLLTSIAARNTRSRRVHERTGFAELGRFGSPDEEWLVVGRETDPAK